MKTIATSRGAVALLAVFGVYGCGSSGGDGAADASAGGLSAPIANLTGTWSVTESGVSNCAGRATYTNGPAEITITQDGNALTVVAPAGTFNGTIDGDRAGWTGSYPANGGTTTIDSMSLTVARDGDAFSGSAQWHWSDGSSSCSGASQSINAERVPDVAPPPQPPSGLSGSADSPSAVELVWNDNSDDELGFKLERRVSGSGAFAQVALPPANATSHRDTGLNALTAYDYRVRAYNAGGDSAYSNVFTVTTLAPPVPAPLPPSDLSAAVESPGAIRLRWSDNSANETSFKIERSTTADGGFAQVAAVPPDATTYLDTGLEAATQYYYRVRATNTGGNSAYSNTASATTTSVIEAPREPRNLEATAVSSSRIDLQWRDRSDDETAFKIERSTSRNEGFTQIGTTAADVTEFRDTGLERFTEYFYRVRATNAGGDSDYSNVDDARTFLFDAGDDDDDDDDDD